MKWQTMEETPERLRRIGGADLTLEQINKIGEWAAEYEKDSEVRNAWGMAVVKFKRLHRLSDGEWTRREGDANMPTMRRVAVKFSRKHFRSAAEAEQWLEKNTELRIDEYRGVEDMGDAYYYMIHDVRDTLGKCREGNACGLGVAYVYSMANEAAQVSEDGATGEGEPVTYDISDVEIFRAGTWKDSSGREMEYTIEDLQNMAAAYDELKDRFEAPVKLGHDNEQLLLQADGLPAAGWLANLRVAGESLIADLKSVPKKVYEILKANGYKKRSLEVIHNFQDDVTGKAYEHMAAGLALLGAQLPAIGSLSAVRALYGGAGEPAAYLYESSEEGIALLDEEDVEVETEQEPIEATNLQEIRAALVRIEARVKEISEKCVACGNDEPSNAEAIISAPENPEEQESEYSAFDGRVAEIVQNDFLEKRILKIPPAFHDSVRRIYASLSAGRGDESRYGSRAPGAIEDFENFIESLGEHGALREFASERRFMNRRTREEDEAESRILKYCRDNGLDENNAGHYARAAMSVVAGGVYASA